MTSDQARPAETDPQRYATEMPESLTLMVGERDVDLWPSLRLHSDVESEEKIVPRAYMPKPKHSEWETPRDLFDQLWEEFGPFDLDPACRREHYTAHRVLEAGGTIYTLDAEPEDAPYILRDGLTHPWKAKTVFVNPPYGAPLKLWVPRMRGEVENGNAGRVFALLPVRADLRWWHENILSEWYWSGEDEPLKMGAIAHPLLRLLRFHRGRLRFEGPEAPQSSATFASVVVGWWK